MKLRTVSPREASMFACITDAMLRPEPDLPPVSETTAVYFFDSYLSCGPKLNAVGFRAVLWCCELAPFITGYGKRFRRLDAYERARFLQGWSESRVPQLRASFKLIKSIGGLSYYNDGGVLKRCGYDPDANVARGRALREKEGRP